MNIIEKLSAASTHNLTIAENVQKVYDAGYESGDYNTGFEAGKKSEYDAFWDAFQNNGALTNYSYAFASAGWTEETYTPKYPIKVTDASYMFRGSRIPLDLSTDFYDFSETVRFLCFVQASLVYKVGVINVTRYSGGAYYAFNEGTSLHTIEKLIVNENTKYQNAFYNCTALEEIRIEGTIGQNGFDIHWSKKLSKASHESIVTHLSTTTAGMSVEFSKTAINKAFETSTGANDGFTNQSSGWYTLIATRQNWTFEYGE